MSIENFLLQLEAVLILLKSNLHLSLIILSIFWIGFFLNFISSYRLSILGIYPRHLFGLSGIVFSPFLHGNFTHIFFNSIPLLVLVDFMLIGGFQHFIYISGVIILLSGFGIWLFGRRGLHIGASALIMGYFSYLLVNAYRHPSVASILLALVCLYYFGSLFLALFPQQERVSWEGHVMGFIAGLIAVFWFH